MKKRILPFLSLLLLCSSAVAQSSSSQDPFKWQLSDNTTVKLGGFVDFIASTYVDGAVAGSKDFITSKITPAGLGAENQTLFDPSSSRLSLEVVQSTKALGDVAFYVETDFRGSDVRLRQVYVTAKGFVVGQAWSFMSDIASNAPTIDIQGVNSRTFLRTPLVGYRTKLTDELSAGISLEQASYSFGLEDYTSVNQQVPDVPFYLQYKLGSGYIKAAGIVRTLQYGNVLSGSRLSEVVLGGQLSGHGEVADGVTLYGQAIYGNGIGRYINDLSSQNLDIVLYNGVLDASTMYGASLGAKVNISKGVDFVASYSQAGLCDTPDIEAGKYSHGNYLSTSVFWSPMKKMTLGAEYLYGDRNQFDGVSNSAQRVSIMVKYSL